MRALSLSTVAIALALTGPVFAEERGAPTPAYMPPELIRQNTALGVMQGHMNTLLSQRDALDVQINTLQKKIEAGQAVADKLR